MDTIGKRISEYRKNKNLKQDELAEKLGVSPQAVSKWENDLSCPDISLLPALSDILCVSIDELVRGKNRLLDHSQDQASIDNQTLTVIFEYDGVECSKINIPFSKACMAVEKGLEPIKVPEDYVAFKNLDLSAILNLVVGLVKAGQCGTVFECNDGKVKAKFMVE